jgi:hypothetical protein
MLHMVGEVHGDFPGMSAGRQHRHEDGRFGVEDRNAECVWSLGVAIDECERRYLRAKRIQPVGRPRGDSF